MNIKKISALILSLIIMLSLTACQEKEEADNTVKENSTINVSEEFKTTEPATEEITEEKATSSDTVSETTEQDDETSEKSDSAEVVEKTTSSAKTTKTSNDPADWSKEKIVDVYKKAARKSEASVVSKQNVEIKKISVNNGQYEGLFEFVTPIISKLIANNSEDKQGVTGGYIKLSASDVSTAKAYKNGKNTVIEMVMKEQVSGARDDALSGSVGHAITAVGDIGVVTDQLKDLGLPLDFSDNDIKIHYTKPVVKVLINSDGKIVNGTWCYTVSINLNEYKAFGKPVDSTSVVMDNTITVNGGFKK